MQSATSLPGRQLPIPARAEKLTVDLPSVGFVAGLGLGLFVIFVLSLFLYSPTADLAASADAYNIIGGVLVGALIIPISLPILKRESLRQGDRRVLVLLVVALSLKIIFSLARHYVVFDLYQGSADAAGYHGNGIRIMELFRDGTFDPGLSSLSDTNFIKFLTGVVYTVIGPSSIGGFLIFSWLAFWGLFLCYRAFVIAVPDGQNRSYGRLLFFFPSLLFWPSSIGKEAWMLFAIGIFAFGAARVLSGRALRGLPIAALGLWLGTLIRPHVPAMLGVALVVAFLVGRRYEKFRPIRPAVKMATLAILVAGGLVLLTQAEGFLKSDLTSLQGITSTLESVANRSAHGGSEFDPPVVRSPLDLPAAFGTVLFRPFVFEANNALAMLSAVEGLLLLLFSLKRLPWILAALKRLRREPYIAQAIVYTLLFVIAFSSLPNFGLLARQRVQLYPFYFVLLCIPPVKKRREEAQEHNIRPDAHRSTPAVPSRSG
jgi:hypothetical protein